MLSDSWCWLVGWLVEPTQIGKSMMVKKWNIWQMTTTFEGTKNPKHLWNTSEGHVTWPCDVTTARCSPECHLTIMSQAQPLRPTAFPMVPSETANFLLTRSSGDSPTCKPRGGIRIYHHKIHQLHMTDKKSTMPAQMRLVDHHQNPTKIEQRRPKHHRMPTRIESKPWWLRSNRESAQGRVSELRSPPKKSSGIGGMNCWTCLGNMGVFCWGHI